MPERPRSAKFAGQAVPWCRPCHGRYQARMRAMSAAMSSPSSNDRADADDLVRIVEVGRQHRHVGGLGDLPEPGFPALDRLAGAFRAPVRTRICQLAPISVAACSTTPWRRCGPPRSRRAGAGAAPAATRTAGACPGSDVQARAPAWRRSPRPRPSWTNAARRSAPAWGCPGTAPTMRQPPSRSRLRPSQRANALGRHPRRVRRQRQHDVVGGVGRASRSVAGAVSPSRAACGRA